MTDAARWELTNLVRDLLDHLRLMPSLAIRLYNAIEADLGALDEAVAAGREWPLQLIDRRYARWPTVGSGGPGEGTVFDAAHGVKLAALPARPVESIAYDLSEMARRRKEEGRDAARTQGGVAEGGVRRVPL